MATPGFFDYLIVGGGIAGVTAAETIRSRDRSGNILIVSKEREPLYSRVLLPNYVRGKIAREKVYLRTFDDYTKHGIDLALGQEVVGVNFDTRQVVTSEEKKISFGKILISAGGEVMPWDIAGVASDRVLRLQTIADADRCRARMSGASSEAIVVGGGFIGLEFIESAVAYGYQAHLFLQEAHYFGDIYDLRGSEIIESNFARNGVAVYPETSLSKIEEDAAGLIARGGRDIMVKGAWVGVDIGVKRNLAVFAGSGLQIGKGIRTDSFLQTGVPGVWAAGDIAEYFDPIFGQYRMLGNWTNAFMQGRIAGVNMSAEDSSGSMEFRTVSGYSITHLGLQITHIGKTEGGSAGRDLQTVHLGQRRNQILGEAIAEIIVLRV